MRNIQSGRVIVVGDIHQNLSYIQAILDREKHWDHLVFLGDYIDTHKTIDNITCYTVRETLEYLAGLKAEYGDKVTFLVGNHDVSYISTYTKSGIPPKDSFYTCSGWTRNKAKAFSGYVDPDWMKSLELCIRLGDWVCVHAGFCYQHFKPFMSEWDNIESLHQEWEQDKSQIHPRGKYADGTHWIMDVGSCRGGPAMYGSPVWLDFMYEFVGVDNVRQLVGHTSFPDIPKWRGENNICIDGMQSYYAVWQNNEVVVRHAFTGEACKMSDYLLERDESI
jgi:hypothetical protein